MPYKALCVLLKLSLLLDNGEAHSPSHFTAFKVVFKLHFFLSICILQFLRNVFTYYMPWICHKQRSEEPSKVLCKYTMRLLRGAWIHKQINIVYKPLTKEKLLQFSCPFTFIVILSYFLCNINQKITFLELFSLSNI